MPKLVNLTGEEICLVNEDGYLQCILSLGNAVPARVGIKVGPFEKLEVGSAGYSFPVYEQVVEVRGLPDPTLDTLYIVTEQVAMMIKDREDVIYPIKPVRNKNMGGIYGYQGFAKIVKSD